ncbi:glycine--tRNA ligase subunit beta [Candidatus Pacearchaeota archaeon]|nr:glycine--tRNA ligase subunit beta [Candidatus Pacearchaeota archaeon]
MHAEEKLKKCDEDISLDFINNPTPLTAMVQKLKTVTYHEKLGTLYEKTLRVMSLTNYLSKHIRIIKRV